MIALPLKSRRVVLILPQIQQEITQILQKALQEFKRIENAKLSQIIDELKPMEFGTPKFNKIQALYKQRAAKEYQDPSKWSINNFLGALDTARIYPSDEIKKELIRLFKAKEFLPLFKDIIKADMPAINKPDTALFANAHLGAGLVGGGVAGVEYDENGNLSFDPSKFALGFLGGAGGSKAVERIFNHKAPRAYALKSVQNLQESYKALSQKKPGCYPYCNTPNLSHILFPVSTKKHAANF